MRLAAFGIVAALVGVCTAFDQYDKRTNFQPVDARISAVSEQCYMEKVEHHVVTKTTMTSDLLPCEAAVVLTRSHPDWRGYSVKHKIEVRFEYVSPADGARHSSSLQMSAFPKDQPMRVGDVLKVLASKTKADKTREV